MNKKLKTGTYSYSFKVDREKLQELKNILVSKNLDISKFLRNAIDKEIEDNKKLNECTRINVNSDNFTCNDCSFKDNCDESKSFEDIDNDEPLPF